MKEDEEELDDNLIPECPYCDDNTAQCEHVLLDYDETPCFSSVLRIYFSKNPEETVRKINNDIINELQGKE